MLFALHFYMKKVLLQYTEFWLPTFCSMFPIQSEWFSSQLSFVAVLWKLRFSPHQVSYLLHLCDFWVKPVRWELLHCRKLVISSFHYWTESSLIQYTCLLLPSWSLQIIWDLAGRSGGGRGSDEDNALQTQCFYVEGSSLMLAEFMVMWIWENVQVFPLDCDTKVYAWWEDWVYRTKPVGCLCGNKLPGLHLLYNFCKKISHTRGIFCVFLLLIFQCTLHLFIHFAPRESLAHSESLTYSESLFCVGYRSLGLSSYLVISRWVGGICLMVCVLGCVELRC